MNSPQRFEAPGPIVFFGSGETAPGGQRIFESIFSQLSPGGSSADPLQVSILETPAGFELNSAQVAGRVGEFLRQHLINYPQQISIIPARRRGTWNSPDNEEILDPLMIADLIFMGPGSPSYAVRQLQGSLAWKLVLARHQRGAALALSSAATIAAGWRALPVYEIYKVGEDPHWKKGLDLLGAYGIHLTFVPHWNNVEGGENLDTSRCFIGRERFASLRRRLPKHHRVVGIDENTGLLIKMAAQRCEIVGQGTITLLEGAQEFSFPAGSDFPLARLGNFRAPRPLEGLSRSVREKIVQAELQDESPPGPSEEVIGLLAEREQARELNDWSLADELRGQVRALGWTIKDTAQGPIVEKNPESRGER